MPKQTIVQESFSAGEISPMLHGRYSSEGYTQGCAILENMYSDPRGPAVSRDGFKHITRLAGNDARVEQIEMADSDHALFVFTDLKLTILSMFGVNPAVNYVTSPRFRQGPWFTTVGGDGEVDFFEENTRIRTRIITDIAYLYRTVTVPATGVYSIIVQTDGATEYRVQAGTSPGDGTFYDVVTTDLEHVATFNTTTTTPIISVRVVPKATPVEINTRYVCVTDDLTPPEFVTLYPEKELHELHFITSPDGSKTYVLHADHYPYEFDYNVTTDVWQFISNVFTVPPGVWSTTNGPAAGTVFQGRLWLGGTRDQPQTFWGSNSGVYDDFDPKTAALPAEGLEFEMQKAGRIRWMEGTKNLLIGTENGEHIVTADQGIVWAGDISIAQQSSYGSSIVQPLVVGDQVFYIGPDARKLRAMQYEWSKDNWLSKDLSFFSEHITSGKITDVTWAQHPDNLLFMATKSGYIIGLNYERGENVWGWHRHITNGEFKDVAAGIDSGKSVLSIAVQHIVNFVDIETMSASKQENMDSWIEASSTTPFTVVTGLTHLEGEVVQVMVDGAVHPDKTVSGGQITLDWAASRAVVGLQFNPKIVFLPIEKGAQGAVSMPHQKAAFEIFVHLLNSALPLVNGKRAPSRSPATPMGTPEPLTTGKTHVHLSGWKNETDITVEQDLPLPLIVTALSGEFNQEHL